MIDVSMISLKRKIEEERGVLERVSQVWSIDQERQSDDATKKLLMDRVQDAHAARSVWEALSPQERTCLFHSFGSGNPARQKGITLESLRKKTKLSPEALEAAVSRLIQWYLMEAGMIPGKSSVVGDQSGNRAIFPFREPFQQLWHTGQELFRSYADRSAYSLEHLVGTFYGDQLQRLANLCHVQTYSGTPVYSSHASPSISHPIEVQKRLYEALCHPLMPFDLLHRLDSLAQEVFLWVCERGGKVTMSEVRSHLPPPARTPGRLLVLLDALEAHALAFDSLSCEGKRWLFIPHDLLAIVKREAQQQVEDEQRYALCPLLEDAPGSQESQQPLLYDLAIAIGMSLQNVIEPTRADKLPKPLRDKIRPFLHGCARPGDSQEDLYVDQVFHTARALELLCCKAEAPEEKRRYLPGSKLSMWSELSLVGQAQQFLEWWEKTSTWQDVRPDGRLLSPSSTARKILLEQLKQCVPGRFYRIDALLYAIWRQIPLNLYDFYHHKLTKPTPLRSRREQWMEGEGATYVGLLASALSELGVVSLGSMQQSFGLDERPGLFCLTLFGAVVLGSATGSQDAPVPQKPELIVQPNNDVLLMQFHPRLAYRLLEFAQIQRMGRICTFHLTQAALLRGMALGLRIEDIMAFLAEYMAPLELSQNVTYTLRDWTKGYREACLTEVIMVETSPHDPSEEDMQRILGTLRGNVRKIASCTFVIVSTGATFADLGSLYQTG